jgi:hypothetical protein
MTIERALGLITSVLIIILLVVLIVWLAKDGNIDIG